MQILARKELNFEKMSERDRKQIVAEVSVCYRLNLGTANIYDSNILKDLNHDNIVRYHDRVSHLIYYTI